MTHYRLTGLKHTAHTSTYRVTAGDSTATKSGDRTTGHDAAAQQLKAQKGEWRLPEYTQHTQTENNSAVLLTDGGRREVDPHIEPEYVGAHSGADADTCQLWTGDEPTPCDNDATHTIVHYDGEYHHTAACDECGEPDDVEDWGRRWSTDRETVATDGGRAPDDEGDVFDDRAAPAYRGVLMAAPQRGGEE